MYFEKLKQLFFSLAFIILFSSPAFSTIHSERLSKLIIDITTLPPEKRLEYLPKIRELQHNNMQSEYPDHKPFESALFLCAQPEILQTLLDEGADVVNDPKIKRLAFQAVITNSSNVGVEDILRNIYILANAGFDINIKNPQLSDASALDIALAKYAGSWMRSQEETSPKKALDIVKALISCGSYPRVKTIWIDNLWVPIWQFFFKNQKSMTTATCNFAPIIYSNAYKEFECFVHDFCAELPDDQANEVRPKYLQLTGYDDVFDSELEEKIKSLDGQKELTEVVSNKIFIRLRHLFFNIAFAKSQGEEELVQQYQIQAQNFLNCCQEKQALTDAQYQTCRTHFKLSEMS